MRSTSIIVSSHTSLSEIQQFAHKLDNGMRLRAKKIDDRSYELYAKDSKPSRLSRITGHSAKTRANSRAALNMVLDNVERSFGGTILERHRLAMSVGIRSKDIKGDAFKVLVDAIDVQSIGEDSYRLENKGPGLDKLPPYLKAWLVNGSKTLIEKQIKSGNKEIEVIGDQLARQFKADFGLAQLDPQYRMVLTRLGLSSGSRFTYELRREIAKDIGDSDALRRVLEHAFQRSAPALIGNQETSDSTIMIDGETYTKGKRLGQGGFGTVFLYTCANDPTRQVALKSVIAQPNDQGDFESQMELLKREGNVHLAALGDGNDRIVGFKGAVCMSNGAIGIAMEYAPHGTAQHATEAIGKAVQDGHLCAAEATVLRLTLVKDMAEGLAHIKREGKNFVHFDFKSYNVLVGDGGLGKIADFGLSAKARKLDLAATAIAANPLQLGPELSRYHAKRLRIELQTRSPRDHDERSPTRIRAESDERAARRRMKGLTSDQKDGLVEEVMGAARLNQMRAVDAPDTRDIDSWGLGRVAFNMLMGRDLTISGSPSVLAERMETFTGDVKAIKVDEFDTLRTDWGSQKAGAFAGSTGERKVDDLLNRLLHPDPLQRMSTAEAVHHPALELPGVGSDESRAKLVAVMKGDWRQLRKLRQFDKAVEELHHAIDNTNWEHSSTA